MECFSPDFFPISKWTGTIIISYIAQAQQTLQGRSKINVAYAVAIQPRQMSQLMGSWVKCTVIN